MPVWDITKRVHKKMLRDPDDHREPDYDLEALVDNMMSEEYIRYEGYPSDFSVMIIVASLIGCDDVETFELMVMSALHSGASRGEIIDILLIAVRICGLPYVIPCINGANHMFSYIDEMLPFPTSEGVECVSDKYADKMFAPYDEAFEGTDEEKTEYTNSWLAVNLFGDYIMRTTMSDEDKLLMEFCVLIGIDAGEAKLTECASKIFKNGERRVKLVTMAMDAMSFVDFDKGIKALKSITAAAIENNISLEDEDDFDEAPPYGWGIR